MKLLQIIDTQCVPIDKIDFIGIDNINRQNIEIHTVGNKTIINHYQSEYDCIKDFNNMCRILNENN